MQKVSEAERRATTLPAAVFDVDRPWMYAKLSWNAEVRVIQPVFSILADIAPIATELIGRQITLAPSLKYTTQF